MFTLCMHKIHLNIIAKNVATHLETRLAIYTICSCIHIIRD